MFLNVFLISEASPEWVWIADGNSWKVYLIHIFNFHINITFELEKHKCPVAHLNHKETNDQCHSDAPNHPVDQEMPISVWNIDNYLVTQLKHNMPSHESRISLTTTAREKIVFGLLHWLWGFLDLASKRMIRASFAIVHPPPEFEVCSVKHESESMEGSFLWEIMPCGKSFILAAGGFFSRTSKTFIPAWRTLWLGFLGLVRITGVKLISVIPWERPKDKPLIVVHIFYWN